MAYFFKFACVVGNRRCQRAMNDLARLWTRDLKNINRVAKINDLYGVGILGVPWGLFEGIKAQRYSILKRRKNCREDGRMATNPDCPSFVIR